MVGVASDFCAFEFAFPSHDLRRSKQIIMRRPCPSSLLQAICLFATAAVLAVTAVRGADDARSTTTTVESKPPSPTMVPTTPAAPRATGAKQRLREGTTWTDRAGVFELTGDRARFKTSDDGTIVLGLENLSLERVIHTLRDDPMPGQTWKVSGLITEFEGRNHILITRAVQVIKPGTAPKSDRPAAATYRYDEGATPAAESSRGR